MEQNVETNGCLKIGVKRAEILDETNSVNIILGMFTINISACPSFTNVILSYLLFPLGLHLNRFLCFLTKPIQLLIQSELFVSVFREMGSPDVLPRSNTQPSFPRKTLDALTPRRLAAVSIRGADK